MRRFAATASVAGLGLMSSAAFAMCGPRGPGLESRIVLFLFGIFLFVAGGSGYITTQR